MGTPSLRLSDFAFSCPLPAEKDIFKFSERVARALLKAAKVTVAHNVSLSSSMALARPKNGTIALNVLRAGKQRGLLSEFQVTQAVFDAKGKAVAWSFSLDPDGDPKRPDRLCARLETADDVKRVLTMKVKPAQPPVPSSAAFTFARPVDDLATAHDLVCARSAAELMLFTTNGAAVRTLKVGGFPRAQAVSLDGTKVVCGLKKLKVFSRAGEVLATLDGHPRGEVTALAFSASGERIASGSALYFAGGERKVSTWSLDSAKPLATRKLEGGPACLGFTSDGGLLVGTSMPETVLRLDAALKVTGELRFERQQMMGRGRAHAGARRRQAGLRRREDVDLQAAEDSGGPERDGKLRPLGRREPGCRRLPARREEGMGVHRPRLRVRERQGTAVPTAGGRRPGETGLPRAQPHP